MDLSILNRRSFLKASAITGAAVALQEVAGGLVKDASAQAAPAAAAADDTQIIKTACRACIHNCAVLAHVRNGRVVKLEGNPEYPMSHGSICAKGLSGIQAVYHPNRNKYPLIRVGERGENKWKRISWKEAIDTIAHKCVDAANKYGAETILVSTGGGGNPAFRGVRRIANALGTPNFFEPGCAQCYLPRTLAYGLQYGGPSTSIADESCLELYNPNTPIKTYVMWGTDPSYSCPGGGGRVVSDLRAKGVKTIVIDPRFNADASKADIWLPIRAGTDVALELARIKYIIDNNLFDNDFVTKWTNLPYLVDPDTKYCVKAKDFFGEGGPFDYVVWDKKTNSAKPYTYPYDENVEVDLDSEHVINGKTYKTGFRLLKERCEPWTIEAAAKECWLDPKQIEKAIRLYAESHPAGLSLGVATDQFPNSVEAAMASVILNALCGNVECPGSIMNRNPSSAVVPAGSMLTAAPKLLPKGQLKKRLGGNEFKGLYQWDASSPPMVLKAMQTGKPYQPRVWLDRSGNKLGVLANVKAWAEASKNVDFICHMFMYPTSMSTLADMLLPATEWLETNMLVENLNKVFARQPVTHTWETEDETLMWSKLAKRCAELGLENCKRAWDPEFMGDEEPYFDSMKELMDRRLKKRINMTWDELLACQPYEFMPYDKWNTYYVYKQTDPKTGLPKGFGTSSKKVECYGDCYITLGRTGKPYALDDDVPPASVDYDPLPYYVIPEENPYNDYGKEYPLVMTNGRLPMYHHGTLRNIPYIREIYPVPEIWVNPVDCQKYGVKQGDWVWVESPRGKVRAVCRETIGVQPGQVYQERFWTPETLNTPTKGYLDCNVNVLSRSDGPYNQKVGTYTLRGYQVKISKADSAPEGVWTKPEDFKPWLPQPTDKTPNPEL
ncbi:MAG: molybdopterin-dependent oxidoreductase [Burkholderiales bacterium]|nr:molybdopterin-dependent oxidoreductase [Burkholderiales bacterium]